MWTPIIEGEDAKQYKNIITEVLSTVNSGFHDSEMNTVNMMYGTSGFILYYSYINYFFQNQANDPQISELVDKTFRVLSEVPGHDLSLGQGVAGTAWVFQHLINNNFIDADFEDIFSELLEETENFSLQRLNNGDYDYLLGGLGYLLLILDSKSNKEKYKAKIEKIVTLLGGISHTISEDKIAWPLIKKLKNFDENDLVYNLGLSHGMPSVIILLGIIYEKYEELRSEIKPMIDKAFAWVLSTKIDNGTSCYGYSVINGNISQFNTLRWCYGDLGIGICFYLTGVRLENKDWQQEGIRVIMECASRIKAGIEDIKDAHLCHGVGGVGHIFNRFYQYTHIAEFKEAAIFCFNTLLKRVSYNSNNNIIFLADKGDFGLVPFGGLMEGSAGISLILLSAISDIEPKWDRAFLLS